MADEADVPAGVSTTEPSSGSLSDYSIPWRMWGLCLSKAGETFRYTDLGFILDDPPELLELPDANPGTPLWGWDGSRGDGEGHQGVYFGGAPYAEPKAIWEYLFKTFGIPPPGHPLRPLAEGKEAALVISGGVDPWGNPLRTQHVLTVAQTRYRRMLLCKKGSGGGIPTLYVRTTSAGLVAEQLVWRRLALYLTIEEKTTFDLLIREVTAMPPYYGLPEGAGLDPWETAQINELIARYAPELLGPFPYDETTLGACKTLWQKRGLEGVPESTAWINRALCCRAVVKWTEVTRARDLALRFAKANELVHVQLCFGRNPFFAPEDAESSYAGHYTPFPTWGEHPGWSGETTSWALDLSGDVTFGQFEEFAKSEGIEISQSGGEVECWLIAYVGELLDTPMMFFGEGTHTLRVSWKTVLRGEE